MTNTTVSAYADDNRTFHPLSPNPAARIRRTEQPRGLQVAKSLEIDGEVVNAVVISEEEIPAEFEAHQYEHGELRLYVAGERLSEARIRDAIALIRADPELLRLATVR